MDGHHSAPGLRVLPAEHGRHDVTAGYQDRPVSRQDAPWVEHTPRLCGIALREQKRAGERRV